MTQQEFLDELAKLNLTWSVNDQGELRSCVGSCPLTAVAHAQGHFWASNTGWERSAGLLGLKWFDALGVVNSADNAWRYSGFNQELRDQLLQATKTKGSA